MVIDMTTLAVLIPAAVFWVFGIWVLCLLAIRLWREIFYRILYRFKVYRMMVDFVLYYEPFKRWMQERGEHHDR